MTLGSTGMAGRALAAGLPSVTALTAMSPEQLEAERFFVQWLSINDPYEAVRSAARSVLSSRAGATAVMDFLESGYLAATAYAERMLARNVAYTQRMVATHRVEYYPRVNAAGRRALQAGTEAELKQFVSTGFNAARELDRQGIADDKLRADLVEGDDRAFVVLLSDRDPGAQVRAWAGRAVAPGTTASDVAEFLNYGWVSAASLDMQTFHRQCADADRQWLVTSHDLVLAAEKAEAEARGTAGEAKQQLLAAAARAWVAVGAQTGPGRVAWAEAEQVALRQADTWLRISTTAAAAVSPHWQTIAGTAAGTREQWLAEQRHAAGRVAAWNALLERAHRAEAALSAPPSDPRRRG